MDSKGYNRCIALRRKRALPSSELSPTHDQIDPDSRKIRNMLAGNRNKTNDARRLIKENPNTEHHWLWPPTAKLRNVITGCHRFPLNNFKYFLTLFSKFFSSFPHVTCSLSVSRLYLALDEIYHPLRAAIPNNSTRGMHPVRGEQDSRF